MGFLVRSAAAQGGGAAGLYYGGPDLGNLTPTIYAAPTSQGTGSGNSEANATTLVAALAAASSNDIVGALPGVYSKASTSSKFYPAWRLTNSGTTGNPIIVVAKYSAIDLAGKTAGARWTTSDLDAVFAHANRSELRHTGGAGGGTGGPIFGSSFDPVDAHQYWIGFCADESQGPPIQDSGPATLWASNSCKILRAVLRGRDVSSTWGGDNHCGVRVEDWAGTAEVSDCVIHGFKTANGSDAGHNHAGILRYSHGNQSGLTVTHNFIFGCSDGIFSKDEAWPDGNAQSEIYRYNILDGNTVGMELATQNMNGASTDSYAEFNLIVGGSSQTGISGQQGNGFRILIRYNTVYVGANGAGTAAGTDMNFFGATGCELTGNIIVGVNGNLLYEANARSSAHVPANYNCYYALGGGFTARYNGSSFNWSTWPSGSTRDGNSINVDPLFTSAAGFDWSLQAGSPCLTAASDGGRIGHTRGGVTPGPRYA